MIQSLNFRLGDSLPREVLAAWRAELRHRFGEAVPVELRRRTEDYLDAGHGECWLRRPDVAQLVEGALLHFDTERYRLLAWCIMPNHVHALIETKFGFPLDKVLHSWKSYTCHEINKILSRCGELWEREYVDRYVRNSEHYENVVAYIEENPVKAGLVKIKTQWQWSSTRFRFPGSAGVAPTKPGSAGVAPTKPGSAGVAPTKPENTGVSPA